MVIKFIHQCKHIGYVHTYDKETRLLNYLCLQMFSMVTVATKVSKGNLLFETLLANAGKMMIQHFSP